MALRGSRTRLQGIVAVKESWPRAAKPPKFLREARHPGLYVKSPAWETLVYAWGSQTEYNCRLPVCSLWCRLEWWGRGWRWGRRSSMPTGLCLTRAGAQRTQDPVYTCSELSQGVWTSSQKFG